MNNRVIVVNHGVGNTIAILNVLRKMGVDASVISDGKQFEGQLTKNSKVIIPGVGSFDAGMSALQKSGITSIIKEFAHNGGEILGICLGMQLLFEGSEEGSAQGLGIIPGTLKAMKSNGDYRVPHVGWEKINLIKSDRIFDGIQRLVFYHNHSFALTKPNTFGIAEISYSMNYLVAARRNNVVGVQFHPEKSHSSGQKLLSNFIYVSPM